MTETQDLEFSIPETEYEFGQDVTFVVTVSNKARQHRVRGRIVCQAVTYNGKLVTMYVVHVRLYLPHFREKYKIMGEILIRWPISPVVDMRNHNEGIIA